MKTFSAMAGKLNNMKPSSIFRRLFVIFGILLAVFLGGFALLVFSHDWPPIVAIVGVIVVFLIWLALCVPRPLGHLSRAVRTPHSARIHGIACRPGTCRRFIRLGMLRPEAGGRSNLASAGLGHIFRPPLLRGRIQLGPVRPMAPLSLTRRLRECAGRRQPEPVPRIDGARRS